MDLFEFARQIDTGAGCRDTHRIERNLFAPEMRGYRDEVVRTRLPSGGFEDALSSIFRPIAMHAPQSCEPGVEPARTRFALHAVLFFAAQTAIRRGELSNGADKVFVYGDAPATDLAAIALSLHWKAGLHWYPEDRTELGTKERAVAKMLVTNRTGFYRNVPVLAADERRWLAAPDREYAGIVIRYPAGARCDCSSESELAEELIQLERTLRPLATCLIVGAPRLDPAWERCAAAAGFHHRLMKQLSGVTVLLLRRAPLPCEEPGFYAELNDPITGAPAE